MIHLSPTVLLSFLLLTSTVVLSQANENKNASVVDGIIEWVRSHGGSFSNKIEIRRMDPSDQTSPFGVYAKEDIYSQESIMHIPKSFYITIENDPRLMEKDISDDTFHYKNLCLLAHKLMDEMKLGEQSAYAPYIRYLKFQNSGQLPALWTTQGKNILRKVLPPGSDGVDWINEHFEETGCIKNNDPFEEHMVELIVQRGYDVSLIPIWDMVNHDNGLLNTENDSIYSDGGIKVRASENIEAGGEIYATYDACTDCGEVSAYWGTPEILRDFGFVERNSQRWVYWEQNIWFELHENEDGNFEVIFDEGKESGVDAYGVPTKKAIQFLEGELDRLRGIAATELKNQKQEGLTVPEHEWNTILQFHSASVTAISEAIKAAQWKHQHDEL